MNNQKITLKDVDYVSKLSRISVTGDEKKLFQAQLEHILEYIDKMQAVNTDQTAPTAHPQELTHVLRDDKPDPFPHRDDLLKNAPETEETYYKVKKVIE